MDEREAWKKELQEGEVLKWTGKPENVKLMDTSSRGIAVAMWAVAITWILLSLVFYLPYGLQMGTKPVQLAVTLLVMDCIPLLMITMPVTDCKLLNRHISYAVTDRRVLVRNKDKVTAFPLESGPLVSVRKRSGGYGHVLVGEAVDKANHKLRSLAVRQMEENGAVTGMVLYHVPGPEQAASHISGKGRS